MEILKRNPERFNNTRTRISTYKFFEYVGAYDNTSLERRLKSLSIGCEIFRRRGYSDYQFIKFHNDKAKFFTNVHYFLFLFFGLFALFLYFQNIPFYVCLLFLAPPFIFQFVFNSSDVRSNILHVNVLLRNPFNLKSLKKIPVDDNEQMKIFAQKLLNGDLSKPFDQTDLSNRVNHEEVDGNVGEENTLSLFHQELKEISHGKNEFNRMPMGEVIEFFSIACCEPCKTTIPQISQSDFILFLKTAFLKEGYSERFSFFELRVMDTYALFYEFFSLSVSKGYDTKQGNKIKYSKLLSDHFNGFEEKKVIDNLRPRYDKRIDNTRNNYKVDLQNVHRLQSIKND